MVTRTWRRADWKKYVDVRRNITIYLEDVGSKNFAYYKASYIQVVTILYFVKLNLKIFIRISALLSHYAIFKLYVILWFLE